MKKYLILIVLLSYNAFGYAQKLFIANSTTGPVNDFINKNNLGRVDFIYQNEFVTNNNYDEVKLIQAINKRFPDNNQSGWAILDWEGVGFDNLTISNDIGDKYRDQFTEAIQKAKTLRPNVKWSYYGLPKREFWQPDDAWRQKNLNLMSFFSNLDFLAPSLYIFYSFDQASEKLQQSYIDKNVDLSRQIGQKINKPVMVLVNHRYHPSNKQFAEQQVPVSLFTFYVKKILNDGADGVVWWHSEEYNYNITKINDQKLDNAVFKADFKNNTIEDGISNMLNKYYSDIKKNISGISAK